MLFNSLQISLLNFCPLYLITFLFRWRVDDTSYGQLRLGDKEIVISDLWNPWLFSHPNERRCFTKEQLKFNRKQQCICSLSSGAFVLQCLLANLSIETNQFSRARLVLLVFKMERWICDIFNDKSVWYFIVRKKSEKQIVPLA